MNLIHFRLSILVLISVICLPVLAQEQSKYLLGEERKLEIIVYILGEVKNPGEYRVYDNTDLAELIARAGGTTDFSNLKDVTITRSYYLKNNNSSSTAFQKQVIKADVQAYLKSTGNKPLPRLAPGDIVHVSKNKWHAWKSAATVVRDLAVVASAYFLYLRATND
ncbi:hypothetical protein GF406_18385 [candidate division KSB1 bacterium]|nr:hypothetical protein [candidate division KSB1 bacterium]